MATTALISVSEYLNTTYRPDRDYIDGEVRERNLGERPHSRLQKFFIGTFFVHGEAWGVEALPEQRVQTSAKHYRVPDVCVVPIDDSIDPIVHVAPLICIEILSSDDSLRDMVERVEDYAAMGVKHIWLVDPVQRHAWIWIDGGFQKPDGDAFRVAGTPIHISLADVYASLGSIGAQ
jgi:Uma2 family endonuclease